MSERMFNRWQAPRFSGSVQEDFTDFLTPPPIHHKDFDSTYKLGAKHEHILQAPADIWVMKVLCPYKRKIMNFTDSKYTLAYMERLLKEGRFTGDAAHLVSNFITDLARSHDSKQTRKAQQSYLKHLYETKYNGDSEMHHTNHTTRTKENQDANAHSLVSTTEFVTCVVEFQDGHTELFKLPKSSGLTTTPYSYEDDVATKGVEKASKYVHKVLVYTTTINKGYHLAVGAIAEIHEDDQINYESSTEIDWLVAVVDTGLYDSLRAQDSKVKQVIAEKRKAVKRTAIKSAILERLGLDSLDGILENKSEAPEKETNTNDDGTPF